MGVLLCIAICICAVRQRVVYVASVGTPAPEPLGLEVEGTHPTHDRLVALGLTGMAKALDEQEGQRNVEGLTFEERLWLLVDREAAERESKRLVTRLICDRTRRSRTSSPRPRAASTERSSPSSRPASDRAAAGPADHGQDRHRQELARLCARPRSGASGDFPENATPHIA